MANPKHLLKLKEGIEVWNTWRKGNPYIIPDLRWADLRCAGLGGSLLTRFAAHISALDFLHS